MIETSVTLDSDGVPVIKLPGLLENEYLGLQFSKDEEAPHRRMQFMRRLWWYFNEEKFDKKMLMPNLVFSKAVSATRMRTRGFWQRSGRILSIHPSLFNSKIHFFTEIFLHEMCHQAVSEIDGVIEREEKGHGPHWKRWMVQVGLDPRRYDPTPNSAYMTPEQRLERNKLKQEKIRNEWDAHDTRTILNKDKEATRVNLSARQFVTYINTKYGTLHGLLICPQPDGNKQMFLPTTLIMTPKYLSIRGYDEFFKLQNLAEVKKFSLKFWNLKGLRIAQTLFPNLSWTPIESYDEVVSFKDLYGRT